MKRDEMLDRIRENPDCWDLIIIGGGATGLGCAVDAASRGYKTVLLERSDFAKGTSSRSTKLVHGGVRYLQQGNFSLVIEALKERGILRQNAPHLVSNLPLIVPTYEWWEAPWTGIGLKLYDIMAGKLGFGKSELLSREDTLALIPTIEQSGLRGGIIYYDGQFDDARLAIHLACTAAEQGAALVNYVNVTGLQKQDNVVSGVLAVDVEKGEMLELRGKAVINATGPFCDAIRVMDFPGAAPVIAPSQGVHLMLPRSFLPGNTAILVPHTRDGRVIFLIPWRDCVMVGTTDTPIDEVPIEPRPRDEEIAFLLEYAARYLNRDPGRSDVLSVFTGVRPLVGDVHDENTAKLSRDHSILISRSGLLTVTGGKWTTYRRMAEDAIDKALVLAGLEFRPCVTENLRIHGYHPDAAEFKPLSWYGCDAPAIQDLARRNRDLGLKLHPDLPIIGAEVVWAVRNEMARTVEDVLSRRTRCLIINAKASVETAPGVAQLMAAEMGFDRDWEVSQVDQYRHLARTYIIE
ncbi:MAG: glycerol-3-phosphate dehydrogenase/oxidase [Methylococcaceae bacterium]|nr:glycerol-3-phosphate dehydrogenase/oxidase [Methylococcaceae bacterium]MCI0733622.1 glycerol-3-phosphate dehydrogenase/oxidase [Methylococcaceae bacterium]